MSSESVMNNNRMNTRNSYNNFIFLTSQMKIIVPQLITECEVMKTFLEEKECLLKKHIETVNDKIDSVAVEIIGKAEKTAASVVQESQKKRKLISDEIDNWKNEQAVVAKTQQFGSIIKLNVGGTKYETTQTTLTRFPDSMLGAMFSGRHALNLNEEGYHFIDRDGTHFRHILNFLRDPEHFTQSLSGDLLAELKKEVAYYGLIDHMSPDETEMTTAGDTEKDNYLSSITARVTRYAAKRKNVR